MIREKLNSNIECLYNLSILLPLARVNNHHNNNYVYYHFILSIVIIYKLLEVT
jgi:hypothetical protein